jgi:hypothetical protein
MNYLKNFIWVAFVVLAAIPLTGVSKNSSVFNLENKRDRGLEIRYVKMEVKDKKDLPKEIKIDGITYPLYQTKEDAYNATINASIRRDITIAYVISAAEKPNEIISLGK